MKIIKKIALAGLVILIGMQFYRPEKNSAEENHITVFMTETNPPKDVQLILEQACYDCHSNNTVYPWYNNIAPVSYWLASHINDGKDHLNFSDWENYTVKEKDHKLEEIIETVEEGEMPLNEYTWTHEEAKLTNEEREKVIAWANKTRVLYQLGQQPE